MAKPDAIIDLGPNATPGQVSMLIRADLEPFLYQLYQLETIFKVSSAFLKPRGRLIPPKRVETRTWCDRHLMGLNYGLLASMYALAGVLVWLATRV